MAGSDDAIRHAAQRAEKALMELARVLLDAGRVIDSDLVYGLADDVTAFTTTKGEEDERGGTAQR